MRTLNADDVVEAVARMCVDANRYLPEDVRERFAHCAAGEDTPAAREVFRQLTENYQLAEETGLAMFYAVLFAAHCVLGGSLV